MIDKEVEEYHLYRNLVEVINQFSNKFSEETSESDASLCNSIIVKAITLMYIETLKQGLSDKYYVKSLLDFIEERVCEKHEPV